MESVYVSVGHQDNLMITRLFGIERSLSFVVADTRANRRRKQDNILVVERFVQTSLFHVYRFAKQGKNCLKAPVAPLFR